MFTLFWAAWGDSPRRSAGRAGTEDMGQQIYRAPPYPTKSAASARRNKKAQELCARITNGYQ